MKFKKPSRIMAEIVFMDSKTTLDMFYAKNGLEKNSHSRIDQILKSGKNDGFGGKGAFIY